MEGIILFVGFVCFLVALGYSMIFKVPDVHYGLPSSLFGGRFKGMDDTGNSWPIHEPYSEGFHFKLPWWKINFISREVAIKKIEKREFPTADGGTVLVSGVIQYRPSRIVLYRYEEVNEQGIKDGLDSELNQIVGHDLANDTIENAVKKREDLSLCLYNRLTGTVLNPTECEREQSPIQMKRKLFGKNVMYSEQSYGIEVLKAKIDLIEPEENLKKAREDQRKEQYEQKSQTTEWTHLLEKMKMLKKSFPKLDDKLILEAVQVWQKQASKNITEFKVADLKEFGEAVASILKGER